MTSQEIIQRLSDGNDRFATNQANKGLREGEKRNTLINNQNPYAVVLSCTDSRVVPEFIFDTGIGELFVARVAGNIANQSTIASIEYAVAHLGINLIVVMGHQNCGAVQTALSQTNGGDNLNHLIEHIQPIILQSDDLENIEGVIKLNATRSAKDLIENSEIISNAVDQHLLEIRTAYYHLDSGKVELL